MRQVRRKNRSTRAQFGAVLALMLMAAGGVYADPLAREKWRAAMDPTSSAWSREALLNDMLRQTKLEAREQAIALLGEPNYSADLYSPGTGLIARIDEYRLSAANTQTLRIDSDSSSKIKNMVIEGEGCACPLCRRASKTAALTGAAVSKFLAALKSAPGAPKLLGSVESALGATGLHEGGQGGFGGRPYWTTTVIWRLVDDPHRYFTVSGRTLVRDYRTDADVPVSDFAVAIVSEACL